jgi:hypothetical protein
MHGKGGTNMKRRIHHGTSCPARFGWPVSNQLFSLNVVGTTPCARTRLRHGAICRFMPFPPVLCIRFHARD